MSVVGGFGAAKPADSEIHEVFEHEAVSSTTAQPGWKSSIDTELPAEHRATAAQSSLPKPFSLFLQSGNLSSAFGPLLISSCTSHIGVDSLVKPCCARMYLCKPHLFLGLACV
jgi:hypothetical protein